MRIDSHHHLWVYQPGESVWLDHQHPVLRRDYLADEFHDCLQTANLDGSVVVQARQTLEETRRLLRLAGEHAFLRGVVGWVDLCSGRAAEDLEEFQTDSHLVGLRHVLHDEPAGFMTGRPFQQGLALLGSRHLAFDLLLFPHQLAEAAVLVERFPEQTFVLDHLAKPLEGTAPRQRWKEDLARLAAFPQVAAKLSGFVSETFPSRWSHRDTEFFLDTAFELFGPQRLMVASNWPVSELAGSYTWTLGLVTNYLDRLPPSDRDAVWGQNAARIYRL